MANESARAIIEGFLRQWGLGALGAWAWDRYLNTSSSELVMLELQDRPEYKTRFAGMEALRKKGRAISEAEYIELERGYAQAMAQANLPTGFYDDPSDFAKFIGGEVSANELRRRIKIAQNVAAKSVAPQVRDELARLYGVRDGDITAFFIDPDKAQSLIETQYVAATAAGAFKQAGLGELSRSQAEALGPLGDEQVEAGTQNLVASAGLLQEIQGEDALTTEEKLGAAFGTDVAAQEKVQRRVSRRKAEFEGGGSYVTTREGVTGLG